MVSTGGGIAIAVVVLLLAAAVGWIVFTQLRARRLGLPPPSLSSYLPWKKQDNAYGPPRPAPGGVVGWFNDQVRKFKNRNNRSAAGAYEQPSHGGGGTTRGRRGFGPLDPDEAWDARVGHEADGYGYYEEQELSGGPAAAGRRGSTEYRGGSYSMNLAATPGAEYDEEAARGRAPTRSPGASPAGQRNPFDDDAAAADSLRGVSPRPIVETADAQAQGKAHKTKDDPDSANSPTERRSMFRENV
ncbi:hypothetical protein JDV02_007972 [Purpureocillium takamizusanense]|uniref:Acid phosphatase-like protein n=1 Tax=Purpureocillium takamizusanense TaxID=2060973 RepID=A0A9Q8QMQ1_9HYPO|nr:uncharacterized protein JDV02_007972 [Purpureocillium takamizusanense]UNI22047.1 hypothetical protein JDV02_007972 [Purpureocillium takamizusanense]